MRIFLPPMADCHPAIRLLAFAALLGAAHAVPQLSAVPPPPPPRYCPPVAYRDYEVVIGRAAALRPVPGCMGPALVRKVSRSGTPGPPIPVPQPSPNRSLTHVWLFLSRLEYTLDGQAWRPLRLIP